MRIIFAILIVVLLSFNYEICEYFYSDDLDKWWTLRINLYAVIIALSMQLANTKQQNKYVRLVLNIGTGLAFSNVVDRWFYNVREFRKEDIIMIALTLGYALYEFKKDASRPHK